MITFSQIKQLFAFETQGKYCFEVLFSVGESRNTIAVGWESTRMKSEDGMYIGSGLPPMVKMHLTMLPLKSFQVPRCLTENLFMKYGKP